MGSFFGKLNNKNLLHLYTSNRQQDQQDPGDDSIFHSELPYLKAKTYVSTSSIQGTNGSKDFEVPVAQLNYINQNFVVLFFFVDNLGRRYSQCSNVTYSYMHGISFYELSRCFYDINVFNPLSSAKQVYARGSGTTPRVFSIDQDVLYTNQTRIGTTLPNIVSLEQVVLENVKWDQQGGLQYSLVEKNGNEILVNSSQFLIGNQDILKLPILARYTQEVPTTPRNIQVPQYCQVALPGQPGYIDFSVVDYATSVLLPGDGFLSGDRWVGVTQAQAQFSQGISKTTTNQVNSRVGVGESNIAVKVPIFGIHGGTTGSGMELNQQVPEIKIDGIPVYQPGINQLYTVSTGTVVRVPSYYEVIRQNISSQQSIDRDVLLVSVPLGLSGHQSGLYQISGIDQVTIPQYREGIADSAKKFLAIPQQSGRLQQLQQFEEGLKIPLLTLTQVGGINQKSYEIFGYRYQVYLTRVGQHLQVRAKVTRQGQAYGPSDLPLTQVLQLPSFSLSILPFRG